MCRCQVTVETTGGTSVPSYFGPPGVPLSPGSNRLVIRPGESRNYTVRVTRAGGAYPPQGPCTARVWVDPVRDTEIPMAHRERDIVVPGPGATVVLPINPTLPVDADASQTAVGEYGYSFGYKVEVGMWDGEVFRGYCSPTSAISNPQQGFYTKKDQECVIPQYDVTWSEELPSSATCDPLPPNGTGMCSGGVHPYDYWNPATDGCEFQLPNGNWQRHNRDVFLHSRSRMPPDTADFGGRRIQERSPSQNNNADGCFQWYWPLATQAEQAQWTSFGCQPTAWTAVTGFTNPEGNFVQSSQGPNPAPGLPYSLEGPATTHNYYGTKTPGSSLSSVFDFIGRGGACLEMMGRRMQYEQTCHTYIQQQMLISCGQPSQSGSYAYVPYAPVHTITHSLTSKGGMNGLVVSISRSNAPSVGFEYFGTPLYRGCHDPTPHWP